MKVTKTTPSAINNGKSRQFKTTPDGAYVRPLLIKAKGKKVGVGEWKPLTKKSGSQAPSFQGGSP